MQALNSQLWENLSQEANLSNQNQSLHERVLQLFFTMLTDQEKSDEAAFELATALIPSRAYELAAEYMKTDADVAAIIQERYIAPPQDLDILLQYPQNSLGYIYAANMKQMGLDPSYLVPVNIDSDTSYIEGRWRQTHDIWHVITGFDISEVGEIGLQAFYLAQCNLPFSGMVIASSLVGEIMQFPEELPSLLKAIVQGWEMGKKAKPFIAQRWEEGWDKPLSQWRDELNVQPLTSNIFKQ